MVPLSGMPRFASWATFNDYLKEQCLRRQVDILRSGQVISTSVMRYRGNDYSVPVAFGHREV